MSIDFIKILDDELKEWYDSGEWNDEDRIEYNAVKRFVANVKGKIEEQELEALLPKFEEAIAKGLL